MELRLDTLQTIGRADAFYEGKWRATDWSTVSPRNILIKKSRFFLRQLKGRRGRILDLGCGGGWRFLATVGPAVGLDISRSSLMNAARVYDSVVQGDVIALPFADESFDLVVSLDILGHIPIEEKDQVLREIHRVLNRGGVTVHYVEAGGDDPLSRLARQQPDLYERYILAPEGHLGIEPASDVFRRFRGAGFLPLREIAVYKLLIYVERVVQYFDNEYQWKSGLLHFLVVLCKPLIRRRLLAGAVNLVLTVLIEILDDVLPDSWAGGALVSYTKK